MKYNYLICFFVQLLFSGTTDRRSSYNLCGLETLSIGTGLIPGDTGEVMGMKGCFRMKEGAPLKDTDRETELVIQQSLYEGDRLMDCLTCCHSR